MEETSNTVQLLGRLENRVEVHEQEINRLRSRHHEMAQIVQVSAAHVDMLKTLPARLDRQDEHMAELGRKMEQSSRDREVGFTKIRETLYESTRQVESKFSEAQKWVIRLLIVLVGAIISGVLAITQPALTHLFLGH